MELSRGVKTFAIEMILGLLGPLILLFILMQRGARRKMLGQFRLLAKRVSPQIDKVADERDRWRSELARGEAFEWVMQVVANPPGRRSR
jgi:hypothetical protein